MKKYYIESIHTIYVDSYKDGELDYVNQYDLNRIIRAENAKKAIELYFEKELYFDLPDTNEMDFYDNSFIWSILCDSENNQATKKDIQLWKMGKKKLYNNNMDIKIHELIQISEL